MPTFRVLSNFFDLWREGELSHEFEMAMLRCGIEKFMETQKQHLANLRAISPWSLKLGDEIAAASEEYLAAGDLWVELADATNAAREKKNAEFDPAWMSIPGFAHGWITPHRNDDGTQTIVTTCCKCGSAHITDFRIHQGQVEFRTFAKTENDDARNAETTTRGQHGNGAAEAAA